MTDTLREARVSDIVQEITAPLAHVTLTADQAEQIADAARARVLQTAPVLPPGLYTDKNADLWQVSAGPVFQRLTLTPPADRGTGVRAPYLGGPAPEGWGIVDPADPAEVVPLEPLGGAPVAAPAEPAPTPAPSSAAAEVVS